MEDKADKLNIGGKKKLVTIIFCFNILKDIPNQSLWYQQEEECVRSITKKNVVHDKQKTM